MRFAIAAATKIIATIAMIALRMLLLYPHPYGLSIPCFPPLPSTFFTSHIPNARFNTHLKSYRLILHLVTLELCLKWILRYYSRGACISRAVVISFEH